MKTQKGFSYTEILVSLLLISSLSLVFLKQAFLLQKMWNEALINRDALILMNDNSELFLAALPLINPLAPIGFKAKVANHNGFLEINTFSNFKGRKTYRYERRLFRI